MWLKKLNYRNGFMWSAVLFLLLAVSFSGYCQTNELTEAELNAPADLTVGELRAILSENESLKEKSNQQTTDYQNQLTELEKKHQADLKQLEIDHQNDLKQLEMEKNAEIAILAIQNEGRQTSYERYESETIWNDIWTFSAGAITGYALNELKNDIFETYDNDDGGIF